MEDIVVNEMDRRRWFRLWRDTHDEITQFMHQHPAMPISEQMKRFERLQVRMAEVRAEAARLRSDESSDREPETLELENPEVIRRNEEWVELTRRTNDPKLTWLEGELTFNRIPHRRNGESAHAPILEVHRGDLDRAWEILTPVDDLPDDHPDFTGGTAMIVETWTLIVEYPDGDDAGLPPEPGEEMELDDLWLRQQDERGER